MVVTINSRYRNQTINFVQKINQKSELYCYITFITFIALLIELGPVS